MLRTIFLLRSHERPISNVGNAVDDYGKVSNLGPLCDGRRRTSYETNQHTEFKSYLFGSRNVLVL